MTLPKRTIDSSLKMTVKIAIQEANIHQRISNQRLLHFLKNCHKKNKKLNNDYIRGEGFKKIK